MKLAVLSAVALLVLLAGCGGARRADPSFRKLDDVRLRNQIVGLRVAYVRTQAGHARLYGMVARYVAGVEADSGLWGHTKAAGMLDDLASELGPVCGDCVGVLSRASARIRG